MKAFLLLILPLIGGLALFIYSGYYNIAAAEPHPGIEQSEISEGRIRNRLIWEKKC